MASDDVMTRLRTLVIDLQSSTGPAKRTGDDSWEYGFIDGQIQAGNDLEMLIDDLGGVEHRTVT